MNNANNGAANEPGRSGYNKANTNRPAQPARDICGKFSDLHIYYDAGGGPVAKKVMYRKPNGNKKPCGTGTITGDNGEPGKKYAEMLYNALRKT